MEKKISRSITTYFFNDVEINEDTAKGLKDAGFEVVTKNEKYTMTLKEFIEHATIEDKE